MKREMDLVLELLLHFEGKSEAPGVHAADVRIDGYTEAQVVLHLNVMAEAGLLVCEPIRSSVNPERIIRRFVFRPQLERSRISRYNPGPEDLEEHQGYTRACRKLVIQPRRGCCEGSRDL